MRYRWIMLALSVWLAAGCGGGGGDGSSGTGFAALSGRLSLLSLSPQLALPFAPIRPQSIVTAQLAPAPPEGILRAGELAVFRSVAQAPVRLTARVQTDEPAIDVVLFDLTRNVAGRTLRIGSNDVYDVIVFARAHGGSYRLRLSRQDRDSRPVELPARYLRAPRHVAREIVVAPKRDIGIAALARLLGAEWMDGIRDPCLLRLPGTAGQGSLASLRDLLSLCARLEAEGLVRHAEPNYFRRLAQTPDDPRFLEQWALTQIRAPAAWTITTGDTGVVVAVIDSGIRAGHPDMGGRVLAGYDFVDQDGDPTDPTLDFSHGTSTAGILGAATNNGAGIAGINWNARILPLRAFDSDGFGTSFRIAQAIRFAAGLDNSSGQTPAIPARIINLSFASDIPTLMEEEACIAARTAGSLLVAAAGNEGTTTPQYPAAYASVLAVGATTMAGSHASYSSHGSWLDLSAPGGTSSAGVLVAGITSGGSFGWVFPHGTSFSAPHVSGVAALVLGVADLPVAELEQLLRTTAQDIGQPGFDILTGFGLVDAHKAVVTALGQSVPTLIPGEQVTVQLVLIATGQPVFSATTTEAAGLAWQFAQVGVGEYFLEAGTDRNFDGRLDDPGEVYGRWHDASGSDRLEVKADRALVRLDFSIAPR